MLTKLFSQYAHKWFQVLTVLSYQILVDSFLSTTSRYILSQKTTVGRKTFIKVLVDFLKMHWKMLLCLTD